MRAQLLLLILLSGVIASFSVYAEDKNTPASNSSQTQDDGGVNLATLTEQQIKQMQSIPALERLVQAYNVQGDIQRFTWTLRRLVELMPNSGELKYQLAVAYAQQDMKTEAYDLLIHMQTQGFGYDLSKDERFTKIRGTKVWDYIVANLQVNIKPFGEGKVAFELPAQDALFESIAYDPQRKQFLIGSAREGKVHLSSLEGKLTDFIVSNAENGLWSVYDLGVDAKNDLLYVISSGVVQFKGYKSEDFGKAGVFKFQLSTGKFLGKYLVPGAGTHILSSLTVGKDGQVFVADGVRNEIYKLEAAGLKLILSNPKLTSIRGLALADDGKTLYFADYALGLFGIDLVKSLGFDVRYNSEKLVLGGIDGLYFFDHHLVAIENGMSPQRVMRLKLSQDGRVVESGMPLDVAQPAFTLPTMGTIVGNNLYFVSNSQKGLYDQYGVLKDSSKLQPVRIFKSDLRFAWGQNGVGGGLQSIPTASSPGQKADSSSAKPKPN